MISWCERRSDREAGRYFSIHMWLDFAGVSGGSGAETGLFGSISMASGSAIGAITKLTPAELLEHRTATRDKVGADQDEGMKCSCRTPQLSH